MTKIVSDLDYLEAANRFATRYHNGTKSIIWTRRREDQLKDLAAIGLDPAMIALELGISERYVRARLKLLGLVRREI